MRRGVHGGHRVDQIQHGRALAASTLSHRQLFDREQEFLERMEALAGEFGNEENPLGKELKPFIAKYRRLLGQTQKLVALGDRMQHELNQLNAKLFASEEKYRNIFECAAEGIFQATPDGKLISANPALARILGARSPQELLEQESSILFAEGRLASIFADIHACDAAEHSFALALPSGTSVWLEIRAIPVKSESGEVARIDGLVSDVTRRKELEQKLYRHATVDGLTGLYNRRHYMEVLETEAARAIRHQTPLSLMILDIDHFKAINDTYGHDVGDLVLRRFAETIKSNLRCDDVVGRIGGEEFSVLMPHVSLSGAAVAAENLREAVAEEAVWVGEERLRFTVSIGVTSRDNCAAGVEWMLKAADNALYRAKREGRNRIEVG